MPCEIWPSNVALRLNFCISPCATSTGFVPSFIYAIPHVNVSA